MTKMEIRSGNTGQKDKQRGRGHRQKSRTTFWVKKPSTNGPKEGKRRKSNAGEGTVKAKSQTKGPSVGTGKHVS